LYGPTEAAVDVTFWECKKEDGLRIVPIGRPIANTQVYILDKALQPVPLGVKGELYLGGAGLARGYLKRPDMTAEKFIPNPFASPPGERIYRTGDLARWSMNETVEFLGRTDYQVKLRGYRIELGEIESVLVQHPSVLEAIVVLRERENEDKFLVCYFTVREGQSAPGVSALRTHLQNKLPDYMVPAAFVLLESLPRTASGKINRKSLPAPGLAVATTDYVAPRTEVEELLAGIWSELLNVPRIGINDNFFELGGHSLLAIRLVSRIRDCFQAEI